MEQQSVSTSSDELSMDSSAANMSSSSAESGISEGSSAGCMTPACTGPSVCGGSDSSYTGVSSSTSTTQVENSPQSPGDVAKER